MTMDEGACEGEKSVDLGAKLGKILGKSGPPSPDEIRDAALEIFSLEPIPLAPAKALLANKLFMPKEIAGKEVENFPDLGKIVEQIALRQELEIFRRWADGQLRDSSAQVLLREIRGDDSLLEISSVFNEDLGDE
jgi:hypothetical protein